MAPESEWNSGWGISYFADHDTTSGVLDYACTERTYNGHKGTDYFLYPHAFHQIYNELIHVVAGALGTIVYKNDGEFDEECVWDTTNVWNAVYIEHADGTMALYGHMKNGSLINKQVGETVAEGEILGVPASSGISNGPHLHFEYWDIDGNWVDPYQGACNSTDSLSAWTDQRSFWNSRLNAITIHHSLPTQWACPGSEEQTNFEQNFHPGDSVYGFIWTLNFQAQDTFYTTINRPDGSLFIDYLTVAPVNGIGIPLVAGIELPDTASEGVWTIETQYYGVDTLAEEFHVQTEFASIEDNDIGSLTVYPNPVKDNLFIELPSTSGTREEMVFEVYNSVGMLVLQKSLTNRTGNDINISTSDFTPGFYSVRLSASEGFWTATFVKGNQ